MPSKNRQERLVDFNILPEQYRPRKLPSRVLFLWIAAIGLALLLVPTFLVSARVRANTAQVEEELEIVRQELQIIPTPVGEVIELTLTLSETNGALQRLEDSRLEVDSVTQVENEITLVGQAIDSASVIGYVDSLKASHVFENVSLLSMDEIAVPYGTITSHKYSHPYSHAQHHSHAYGNPLSDARPGGRIRSGRRGSGLDCSWRTATKELPPRQRRWANLPRVYIRAGSWG